MTKEEVDKPFIIINDVQISAEDLPAESQGIFNRLQKLIADKSELTLDLGQNQASINFFSGILINVFNKSNLPSVDGLSDDVSPSDDEEIEIEADEDSIEKSNN
tara:strand:- start:7 stop:318 length:312 start_codon:yes stop_codon:yes gene_type:complete